MKVAYGTAVGESAYGFCVDFEESVGEVVDEHLLRGRVEDCLLIYWWKGD